MNERRFLPLLCASAAAGALAGLAAGALRPAGPVSREARAVEATLAQGFLAGYSLDAADRPAEAAAASPGDPSASGLYRQALIAYVRKDVRRAVGLLEQAAKADPADERVRNALSRIRQEVR